MCGRFSFAYEDFTPVLEAFNIINRDFEYPPRYNIAPGQMVPAIIASNGRRKMGALKWGLIPAWAESDKTSFKTINARAETLLVKPAFKNLVSRKRCIIPTTGFFEWRRSNKQPMHIRVKKREVFGFAGLYDTWKTDDGSVAISTCTIITCAPNFFMNPIHDRMPVILRKEDEDLWLDRSVQDPDLVMPLLRAYSDHEMYAYPVSRIVGNVANDVEECITPV